MLFLSVARFTRLGIDRSRVFGGMANSVLFSAFESWWVCEHNKVDNNGNIDKENEGGRRERG